MDSVVHGEREQFQNRRLSQDLSALRATLAARSGRQKALTQAPQKSRAAAPHVPEVIVEEGHSEASRPNAGYDFFLGRLREKLMDMKDSHGRKLYTSQQIQAQLDDSQVCPINHFDRSFGEMGGIVYFGRGPLGMEHSHMEVTVDSLTTGDSAFINMDAKWESLEDSGESSFRWIHLPANNMEWARNTLGHILAHYMAPEDEDDPAAAMVSPSALEDQILRPELWEGQQNVGAPQLPHARFMRPFCHKIDASISLPQSKVGRTLSRHDSVWSNSHLDNPIQAVLGNSMVLFMPYMHWETTLAYHHMKEVIVDVDAGGIGVFGSPEIAGLSCGTDEKLLRHYLQRLQPIHIRRTLDQFGYYTIADTTSRDKDQVVDRYARAHHTTDLVIPPMLMVDQCWLWILGNDTVLTCFPHRWNKNFQSDSTDVYENILELLDDPLQQNKVQNAGQLASLIIERCAGNILDRTLIKDENLRFLDVFDWSIDDLYERQSQCLQALWQDVQESRHDGDSAEGLTDISKEFDILEKIKDIIDELQIFLRLIDQQIFAFNMVLHDDLNRQSLTLDNGSDGVATPVNLLRNATISKLTEYVDFPRLQENAKERAENIKAMIDRANATYNATLDVLSLKQQQANISEARSSRKAAQEMEKMAKEAKKSAEESEKQSYSIMLFTVVTIFFLPMSSVASIFGVNAVEFGQGTVHLSTIFAYVIPISVFVVYISFFLAFNHKARRSILLCLQICRAYINLALPIVFDEHKESRLQRKLKELRERRHEQRDKMLAENNARITEEAAAVANSDGISEEIEDQEKADSAHSAPYFSAFQRERSRFNSVATMGVFGWKGMKPIARADADAARPVPSRLSSYGQNGRANLRSAVPV